MIFVGYEERRVGASMTFLGNTLFLMIFNKNLPAHLGIPRPLSSTSLLPDNHLASTSCPFHDCPAFVQQLVRHTTMSWSLNGLVVKNGSVKCCNLKMLRMGV